MIATKKLRKLVNEFNEYNEAILHSPIINTCFITQFTNNVA